MKLVRSQELMMRSGSGHTSKFMEIKNGHTHVSEATLDPNMLISLNLGIQLYLQFVQLLLIDGGGCIKHYITTCVVFGKRNKVANGFAAAKDRTQPVKTKRDATVRRCSIFKGTE